MLEPMTDLALAPAAPLADRSGATSDAQLADLWIRTKRSEHTRSAYARDVARLFAFLDARGATLRTCTAADAIAFAESLEGAPATRARRLAAVRSLAAFAMRTGYLRFDVWSIVEAPRVDRTPRVRLTEADVGKLLAAVRSERDRVLFRTLYLGGLRISEALALTAADLDGAVLRVRGKGDKIRFVRVTPELAADLAALGAEAGPDAPLFRTRTRRALHPSAAREALKRVARRAGLEGRVSPHDLRHAHASHALNRGAPLSLVRDGLGHASIATTGRYLHARPEDGAARYLGEV